MTRKQGVFFAALLLALFILAVFAAPLAAQRGDTDGDGLPDSVDSCPTEAGPRTNGGCPLPTRGENIDQDGDGVPDFVDACPDAAGMGFTNGCPVDNPDLQVVPQPQIMMIWQSTTECMVGVPLTSSTNVNVRDQPTTAAPIIGQLAPGQQFAPYFRDYDENGDVWFGGAPAGSSWGWVAGSVVIDNGQCVYLPMVLHVDANVRLHVGFAADQPTPTHQLMQFEIQIATSDLQNAETHWNVPPLPDDSGGVEHTDSWDDQGIMLLPLNFVGDPGEQNPTHFVPILVVESNPGPPDSNPGPPDQNPGPPGAFGACVNVGVSIGTSACVSGMLLLPALGDASGQCPPQTIANWLKTGAPDPAADHDHKGWIELISISASPSGGMSLLLPAVQKVREAAARTGDSQSDLTLRLDGDGSVMPMEQLSLNYEQIRIERIHACTLVVGTPTSADGASWGWNALILPYMEQSN